MPRSSGGGSHSGGYSSSSSSSRSRSSGGGSHSGGYSSSSHSYSSSGSGGSYRSHSSGNTASKPKTPPTARLSDNMFRGAKKYVYYKDGCPQYCYSDYGVFTAKRKRRLVFWIPFLIVLAIGLFSAVRPSPLNLDYDNEIYISDTLHLIDDSDSLFSAMTDFRDTTGITPFVVTIANESWNQYYDNLYSMAFDLYVNQFEDEKHWLIVYSEPASPDSDFNDWYWEGIQGDETVYILTEKAADDFGIAFQKYLTNRKYSVGEAFTKAFNDITPVIMEKAEIDFGMVFAAILLMALAVWFGIKRTGIFDEIPQRPANLPVQATVVKPFAKEITCEYCGGVYLSDSFNCPHCGAGRKSING